MAKVLVAVTNVKHDGVDYAAGSELDHELFTKDQLKALYDAGAVAVEDKKAEAPAEAEEATDSEAPVVEEAAVPAEEADSE